MLKLNSELSKYFYNFIRVNAVIKNFKMICTATRYDAIERNLYNVCSPVLRVVQLA
jgi:hypothetical protein